jgi:hypothetical protein
MHYVDDVFPETADGFVANGRNFERVPMQMHWMLIA